MAYSSFPPTEFSDIHADIIRNGILPRLDGPSLSTAGCASTSLHALCNQDKLWEETCKSTWPSIADPRVSDVVSAFPDGHHSLFRQTFPALLNNTPRRRPVKYNSSPPATTVAELPEQLISAIDVHHNDKLVYSKVEVTDTTAGTFLSQPMWMEMEFNDQRLIDRSRPGGFMVIENNEEEEDPGLMEQLKESVTLSWIVIDPARKLAGNFSSVRPMAVRRNWMTNEIQLRFVTVLGGAQPWEAVQCRIELTCGTGGEELRVSEITLQIHDMDSRCLTGRECLVIMRGAMEGGRRNRKKMEDEIAKREYENFLEMRKEWRQRNKRKFKGLNMAFRAIQITILLALSLWICRLLL